MLLFSPGCSSLPEMAVAARGVLFAPAVTAVANKVLGSLAAEGRPFYGVHLRLEQDWVSFGREVGNVFFLIFYFFEKYV